MQNKNFTGFKKESRNFVLNLSKARDGDNQAMEELIELFEYEINSLCKYIKVSKEDVVQELNMELISLVRNG